MYLHRSSAGARVQSGICVLAVTAGLAIAPGLLAQADAVASRAGSASSVSECATAKTALTAATHRNRNAKAYLARARSNARKAAASHLPAKVKAAKVKAAKATLARAKKRYAEVAKDVAFGLSRIDHACAPATSVPRAHNVGTELKLLAVGDGLDLGALTGGQLSSVLDRLVPGAAGDLNPARLTALLGGFNASGAVPRTEARALLLDVLSPTEITGLLGGAASPEALAAVATHVADQVGGLANGFPVPGSLDLAGLFETFSGVFGNLDPGQLGSLLGLAATAFGAGSGSFDAGQLTSLLDSLAPGVSGQFDPAQLTAMLGGLNASGVGAGTLSNLLGGQFSVAQLQSVIGGTADPALVAAVISQVVAQLATAGGGGLVLPGALDAGAVTSLISTVTDLFAALSGGGILPSLCVLLPVLCP